MSILGQHWVLDASGCAAATPADRARVEGALLEVPRALGLTPVGEPAVAAVEGPPAALVGVVLLSESHLALHLFPGEGRLHVDLFSCRPFDTSRALALLEARFGFARVTERVLERRAP